MVNPGEVLKNYIDEGFGTKSIPEFYTAAERGYEIQILVAENAPYEDFNSYSTFGLYRYDLDGQEGKMEFGIEILAAALPQFREYAQVLVQVYSYLVDQNTCLPPGSCLRDAVKIVGLPYAAHLPHVYFCLPLYWLHDFDLVTLNEQRDVRFLMIIPISESEYEYWQQHGDEAFEKLLIESEVDVFDLNRERAV